LRWLMLALWTVIPGLLIAGLFVARHRFPEQMGSLNPVFGLLIALQTLALGLLFNRRLRYLGPAFTAVLAVWLAYIVMVEPLERRLYDTRTFTLQAHTLIQQEQAPLVLHALGKDAKAIKFMVNLDCDRVPLFTQLPAELAPIQAPAWLIMSQADYEALSDPRIRSLEPVLTGQFDKNPYVLLHLTKPTQP